MGFGHFEDMRRGLYPNDNEYFDVNSGSMWNTSIIRRELYPNDNEYFYDEDNNNEYNNNEYNDVHNVDALLNLLIIEYRDTDQHLNDANIEHSINEVLEFFINEYHGNRQHIEYFFNELPDWYNLSADFINGWLERAPDDVDYDPWPEETSWLNSLTEEEFNRYFGYNRNENNNDEETIMRQIFDEF